MVQGPLSVPREIEREAHVGGRDAVEHERAYALAVLPQVDQSCPRAVGPPVDVDACVAEMSPDLVEVVHGDGCRVITRIGVVACEALLQPLQADVVGFGQRGERVLVASAVERVRLTRAPLVHQHDVAIRLDPPEQLTDLASELRGPLAGAAGKKHQGIRRGIGAERWQHHNLQRDAASRACGAILEHVEPPAERVGRRVRARAGR